METVSSMAELRTFLLGMECPSCLSQTLRIELRKETTEQQSGCRVRREVTLRPWIVCDTCGLTDRGEDG